ncbi:hypothetical protein HYH03_001546 [Edaphochlamys debaryana]|uniref:Glutathione S-transferase n=1 Tax=Edaphochlamys debaryana TaxID=47281 RepID=A0A836C6C9_9CHLO|nr:hypothetical protein HYH03_001546 [Edaphochlamys debaryana]|eukprot:KAG2500784.1 hypothetical protein HYH03_001546 [Edaphochlamys debaryana]
MLAASTRRACAPFRGASRRSVSISASAKSVLYSVPVSNYAARIRYIIQSKGLQSEIDIVSPQAIGGLKSEEYLKLNPQGKMPLMVLPDGTALPESEVIVGYVLDKYAGRGPSLQASTPEARAQAALATRIHDIYLGPAMASMYKPMGIEDRAKGIAALAFQMDVLEGICKGPFMAGSEVTSADAALFPSFVFIEFILPKFFGWKDVFAGRPKLAAWWAAMKADPVAAGVMAEVRGGLEVWEKNNRWKDLGILEQVASTAHKWAY